MNLKTILLFFLLGLIGVAQAADGTDGELPGERIGPDTDGEKSGERVGPDTAGGDGTKTDRVKHWAACKACRKAGCLDEPAAEDADCAMCEAVTCAVREKGGRPKKKAAKKKATKKKARRKKRAADGDGPKTDRVKHWAACKVCRKAGCLDKTAAEDADCTMCVDVTCKGLRGQD